LLACHYRLIGSFTRTTYPEISDQALQSLLLRLSYSNKGQPDESSLSPSHTGTIDHERVLQPWHLHVQFHGPPRGHRRLTFQLASAPRKIKHEARRIRLRRL